MSPPELKAARAVWPISTPFLVLTILLNARGTLVFISHHVTCEERFTLEGKSKCAQEQSLVKEYKLIYSVNISPPRSEPHDDFPLTFVSECPFV